jgi:Ca2+-binding RTX toxin-like protein
MTDIDYAWLATAAYNATIINKTPVPGWTALTRADNPDSGFTAAAYQNGNQIVIAYAGTGAGYEDWTFGNAAALGLATSQAFEAMRFYLDVKATHPGATFSFTGHSLGGGLASMMAVFFDKPATVFDAAPFQLAAVNPLVLTALEARLLLNGYTDLDFATYNLSFGALFPSRESNVQNNIYLEGEALETVRAIFPTITSQDTSIPMGDTNLDAVGRHSMALLTAMQVNDDFAAVVRGIPNFANYLLSTEWFGNASTSDDADLLRTLLDEEYGTLNNGKLGQFVAEINELRGNDGGAQNNALIQGALVATVMNYYYNNVRTTVNNLFTHIGNSLNFKYSDVGTDLSEIRALLAHEVAPLVAPSAESADRILNQLKGQNAWHIHTGSGGMSWTSNETENDAVIGGIYADNVNAGAGNDLLFGLGGNDDFNGGLGKDEIYGGTGNDTLTGGGGNDYLEGGTGNDTYIYNSGDGFDATADIHAN